MPQLYAWSDTADWSDQPGKTFVRNGYAISVPEQAVLALVDPPSLAAAERDELELLGPPTHILLTCNYHLREAIRHRETWGCTLMVHRLGADGLGGPVDGVLEDGDVLWDTVQVIHLPHVYSPEETAFLVRPDGGALLVGDALCGGRADIGVAEGEVGIFSTAYIDDVEAAYGSLAQLLRLPFETICFGHGSPVRSAPHAALSRFLRRDDLWGERAAADAAQS